MVLELVDESEKNISNVFQRNSCGKYDKEMKGYGIRMERANIQPTRIHSEFTNSAKLINSNRIN